MQKSGLGTARMNRRRFLGVAGAGAIAARTAWADGKVDLGLPGGPSDRDLTTAFPEKGAMVLQRTRPPLLETPFEVFDRGIFTPNDQFFVRWHWAVIPESVDLASFRLNVRGHVNQPLSLSMADLLRLPRIEQAAVNQCSGNSRGYFQPRVAGGEWGHGAMGNAKWTGLRLRDLLDRAGVKAGAVQVRFNGLDDPAVPDGPDFIKSLDIDHARNGEVMLAYQMNGAQLPLLNGFPIRLVVPGWYSTYWIKMLNDIEVLAQPDDNYWMKTAYRIPDTPGANVKPGETGFKTVPINRMVPRSFFTNVSNGRTVRPSGPVPLRGIAFGGRLWCPARRHLQRWRQVMATRHARRGRRKIRLPAMDLPGHGARFRHFGPAGAMHEHERPRARHGAELERRRLHAQRDRARFPDRCMRGPAE